ncbi:MAG: hypothetical protein LQ346_004644 [Caloplaca aetnensis]|nr:MAG: hypothetical protein LQ346_004644 [Caloplaca aetnensis]
MAVYRPKLPDGWLEPDSEGESPFLNEKPVFRFPGWPYKRFSARRERRRKRYAMKKLLAPSFLLSRKTKILAREARKQYRLDDFSKLPTELILAIMKQTKVRDLKNLVQADQRTRSIAKRNVKAIHIGIQEEQFPEYHRLFGTFDSMTPEQEYHAMLEEENREWWRVKDNEQLMMTRSPHQRLKDKQRLLGNRGRIALYSTLAKDIEVTRIALCREEEPPRPGSARLTEKALMLFWKMQWNDRPGLEHLGERSETEDYYLDIRNQLFANEMPEVRSRFVEILTFVGSRLWRETGLWQWIKTWYAENMSFTQSRQHINTEDVVRWARNVAADLTVETILKISIGRALRMDHLDACDPDLDWIHVTIMDRLAERLDEATAVLTTGIPAYDFRFGQAIGLRAEKIVG